MMTQKPIPVRLTAVLLLLCFLFSAAACSGNGGNMVNGPTKTVTDIVGREVQVPEAPQRVVCMYASTAHMMAMLGKGQLIVGASDGVTRDQMMVTKYPSIEDVPTPYHEGAVNGEEVLVLDPDLILIKQEMYEKDTERQKLDDLGIPYVVADYYSLAQLKQCIQVLGAVFSEEEKAESYCNYMEQTISDVRARLSDVPEDQKPRVYHSITEATKTDIIDSLCGEIMKDAGLVDVSAAAGVTDLGKNATVTLEQIYRWDPDAIVCNEYAVTDYILSQQKWSGLSAVQNKKVYTLPIGATRWCHHGSMEPHMAVLYLAQLFYPEKFQDLDLGQTVRQYYADYFDMQLDDTTLNKVFSGKGMRESSPTLEME
ncbi:MAG: ABC transporter substrate-binding protein [Clostridia bacterium]|nr:ABC transporter substrate-binding protein [Clostridia bacterium]